MQLYVNGAPRSEEGPLTLQALVERLELPTGPRGVAVSVNGEVVTRSAWAETKLQDDDEVEIVTAVSGG